MPHIHTNDYEHDFTITAYIVRTGQEAPKVLLHRHKKYNMLLPVGGHIELTETPWQAVAHEVAEESGYKLEQLKVLQPTTILKKVSRITHHPYPVLLNTHDVPGKHFHSDIAYGLVANSDPQLDIAEGESTELRWLTKEELLQLPVSDIYENTRQVYLFILDEALKAWEQVPTSDFTLHTPSQD